MVKTFVFWTPEEVMLLKQLVRERGMSAKKVNDLAKLPRHGLSGISAKMSELGIGNPEFGARFKRAKRIPKADKERFVSFLRGEGRHMPSRDVARRFGIRQGMVDYYRRRFDLHPSSKERCSSLVFRVSHRDVVRALREGLGKYRDEFWENQRALLLELLANEDEPVENPRTCKTCGSAWPLSEVYFYRAKGNRLAWYCRGCGIPSVRYKKRTKNNTAA